MSSTQGTSNIVCPFFRSVNRPRSIGCEGTDDGNTILIQFRTEGDFLRHIDAYCRRDCGACPVCLGLAEGKYGEEGER